ncbi:MAG TPA: FAD-dependent monooxygenase [Solirubrobacteraceae bacterium]|nr:FAD-dependent monooxygenase [Solirubrobacteraceae bacterium]
MHVIVVGGGIGGLSATIALRQRGHTVDVLERAPQLDAVGAGLTLFANAMHALRRLELGDAVASHGAAVRHSAVLDRGGRELACIPEDLVAGAYAVHRADLQRLLADAVGEIHLDHDVVAVEERRDAVLARTRAGLEVGGDLLVAADGVHSAIRSTIDSAAPRYAGYAAWRGVAAVPVEPGRLTESWGVAERFGLVDIGGGRTYWFATQNASREPGLGPSVRSPDILKRYSSWHSPIAAVIAATEPARILRNDVYDLEPLPQWSRGRIVLLGDAAHATSPGIGQGAAMAIEDAVVLGEQLSHHHALTDALKAYEANRRPRTRAVLTQSRQVDRAAQMQNRLGCRLRNIIIAAAPAVLRRRQLAPIVLERV